VLKALERGKHVFVEKPLCMTLEELEAIREAYERREVHLMVGFNRRFAPLVERLKARLPDGRPRAISYRVNAGTLPPDHWIHDPHLGGGRIVGEVCHFVDLARHLAGAPPTSVAAHALDDPHGLQDTLTVSLGFENGSTASVAYFSNGSKALGKEHLEVFCAGRAFVLDDFARLTTYDDRALTEKLRAQDKGHREEAARFLQAIRYGRPTPIPFGELYESTRATLAVLDALRERRTIQL
jgi:polar amino acid transport system substrate-binding protein